MSRMTARALLLLGLLLAAGSCSSRPPSPFVRITSESGRIYYARYDRSLHSDSQGWVTFRDLVTGEQVRLLDGTYTALECPPGEIAVRQDEYLADPTRVPRAEDGFLDPTLAK